MLGQPWIRLFSTVLAATIAVSGVGSTAYAAAFGHSKVGIETEYLATHPSKKRGDSRKHTELLSYVQAEFPGSKSRIAPWEKFANALDTVQAAYRDKQGRTWAVVPEKMTGERFDGFELITPPLTSDDDVESFGRVVDRIRASGEFGEGPSSSTQFTFDVSHLVGSLEGDRQRDQKNIAELVDLILFLEMNMPSLYELTQPARYGHTVNSYAVPLAVNQKGLLRDLAAMPRASRTYGNVRQVFLKYESRELELIHGEIAHAWKFRAVNYGKLFGLGIFLGARVPVIEFRISDLVQSSGALKAVGTLFARAIAVGEKSPIAEFQDPLPFARPFKNNSSEHADLDHMIRSQSPQRATRFLTKLGLAPQLYVARRCEQLFR